MILDEWYIVMCSRHDWNCENGPCPGCGNEKKKSDKIEDL